VVKAIDLRFKTIPPPNSSGIANVRNVVTITDNHPIFIAERVKEQTLIDIRVGLGLTETTGVK